MMPYLPGNWYWLVGKDNEARIWSSAARAYVAADDPAFRAWQTSGAKPTRIANEAELVAVLLEQFPAGSPVLAWSPSRIVAAIKAIDPIKAERILAGADEVTKAEFFTARLVREDDPRLVAAIAAAGISIDELKQAVT